MQVIGMGFKYKSTVWVRLDYCNVYICAWFLWFRFWRSWL